jgi:hypothetical protein
MTPLNLLLLALFAWRVAYMLVKESGPFDVFTRLRAVTTVGGVLTCIYCCSVWTGLAGYLLMSTPLVPIVYVGAISGGAMMMWRYTGSEHG